MPHKNVTSFTMKDVVMIAGKLSGVTGENNIVIRWRFPNGAIDDDMQYYVKNNDTINIGISAEWIGSGSGSVSVILQKTGETLATYYFTVADDSQHANLPSLDDVESNEDRDLDGIFDELPPEVLEELERISRNSQN